MDYEEFHCKYNNELIKNYRCRVKDGLMDIGGLPKTTKAPMQVAIGNQNFRMLMQNDEWTEFKGLVDGWFKDNKGNGDLPPLEKYKVHPGNKDEYRKILDIVEELEGLQSYFRKDEKTTTAIKEYLKTLKAILKR